MRGAGQHNPTNYAGESHRGNLGGAASDVDGGERGGDAVRCDDVSDQSRQQRKRSGDVHDDVRNAERLRGLQREPEGGAVTYTAPSAIPAGSTVTVTATLVADMSLSTSAKITIVPPIPIAVRFLRRRQHRSRQARSFR